MEETKPRFKKYILVCEHERPEGACCSARGSAIREKLKKLVQEKGLAPSVRVSRAGCLDVCEQGPNVLIMPDDIWLKHVSENDVESIVERVGKLLG